MKDSTNMSMQWWHEWSYHKKENFINFIPLLLETQTQKQEIQQNHSFFGYPSKISCLQYKDFYSAYALDG